METFAFPVLEASAPRIRAGELAQVAGDALALARAEAEQIRLEAAEQGRAEGLAQAHLLVEPACTLLAAAARELTGVHEEFLRLAETRAVELALAIAEKIVGASLEVRPELVLELATGALRAAGERDHVVLLVNPDDLELLREAAGDLSAALGGIQRLEIVPERRIARGGCIVQTAAGEIDATVQTQLARAQEVLTASLRQTPDA